MGEVMYYHLSSQYCLISKGLCLTGNNDIGIKIEPGSCVGKPKAEGV